jgi:hypothetical protein
MHACTRKLINPFTDFGLKKFCGEASNKDLWDKLGRWHLPDPAKQYASPYVGMGNNPACRVDLDCREDKDIWTIWLSGPEIIAKRWTGINTSTSASEEGDDGIPDPIDENLQQLTGGGTSLFSLFQNYDGIKNETKPQPISETQKKKKAEAKKKNEILKKKLSTLQQKKKNLEIVKKAAEIKNAKIDPKRLKIGVVNRGVTVNNRDGYTLHWSLEDPMSVAVEASGRYFTETGTPLNISLESLRKEIEMHTIFYKNGWLEDRTRQSDCLESGYDNNRFIWDNL